MNIKKITSTTIITLSLLLLSIVMLAGSPQRASALSLAQDSGPIYIVQSGDTLSSIALRFGVSSEDIQSANGITDPDAITIGQQLVIPGLEGISGLLTSEVVAFGSSLTDLSREYQISPEDLATLNHLISPSEAIAGMKFIVAVNQEEDSLSPMASISTRETTLEKAVAMGASPWDVIGKNKLEATWDILPGETLYGIQNDDAEEKTALDLTEILISPLPAVQGETLEITVATDDFTSISGTFMNQPLSFYSDDDENYYSFFGIHAMSDVGPFPLEITMIDDDGTTQSFEQLVLVSSGGYGNDAVLTVDDIYVDPVTIAAEDEIINAVLIQYTSERYWDGLFQYPIDEPCINGYFGQRRNYNNGALYYYHTGVDFEVCAPNLNIYAPAAGKVVYAAEMVIRGNAVLVDHGWGVYSGYWHLSEFNVSVGDYVQPGDLIGLIGNTGRSVGPHLHFEIDIGGTPVNPITWLEQVFP